MIKRFVLLALCAIVVSKAFAQTFEANGIRYKILSGSDLSRVEVIAGDYPYVGEISIPSVVTYEEKEYIVTQIGANAFQNSVELTAVVIPPTVIQIGTAAFQNTGLLEVSIPNSVVSIAENAFDCENLKILIIQDGEADTELKMVASPSGNFRAVTKVYVGRNISGSQAPFMGVASLIEVEYGDKVTIIGGGAFKACSSLTKVVMGDGIEMIGGDAFMSCHQLREIKLGKNVNEIGNQSFYSSINIENVEMSPKLTKIGSYAFAGCTKLSKILMHTINPPECGYATFSSRIYSSCVLSVPKMAEENYRADSVWKNFSIIEENGEVPGCMFCFEEEMKVCAGSSFELPINLINSIDVVSFQFDLILPEEIVADTEAEVFVKMNENRQSDVALSYNLLDDGSIRIIGISLTSTPIVGNEGELLSLALKVCEQVEGDYSVEIEDVLIVDTKGNELSLPNINGVISVLLYEMGDSNTNGVVNVADASNVVDYVLGKNPQPFSFEASDVNQNNEINIADASGIVNIVLGKDVYEMASVYDRSKEVNSIDIENGDSNSEIFLYLSNTSRFSGFQFDLNLPIGVSLVEILSSDNLPLDYNVEYRKLGDGKYKVIGLSLSNSLLKENQGRLLKFVLEYSSEYKSDGVIEVDNVLFTTPNAIEFKFESVRMNLSLFNSVSEIGESVKIFANRGVIVIVSDNTDIAEIYNMAGVSRKVNVRKGRNEYLIEPGILL